MIWWWSLVVGIWNWELNCLLMVGVVKVRLNLIWFLSWLVLFWWMYWNWECICCSLRILVGSFWMSLYFMLWKMKWLLKCCEIRLSLEVLMFWLCWWLLLSEVIKFVFVVWLRMELILIVVVWMVWFFWWLWFCVGVWRWWNCLLN